MRASRLPFLFPILRLNLLEPPLRIVYLFFSSLLAVIC